MSIVWANLLELTSSKTKAGDQDPDNTCNQIRIQLPNYLDGAIKNFWVFEDILFIQLEKCYMRDRNIFWTKLKYPLHFMLK